MEKDRNMAGWKSRDVAGLQEDMAIVSRLGLDNDGYDHGD